MSADVATSSGPKNPVLRFLFHHEIDEYPTGGKRMGYLALAVLATITLYYTYFTQTGVTPNILQGFHMSFTYYVWIVVISNALGAFASLAASVTDRIGRTNVVIYGLLIVGAIIAFGVTSAKTQFMFAFWISVMGLVEGAILVATPSLVRDFSPQMGRASAMGFWTIGPVAGSLLTSIVASNTLNHFGDWQSQFWISGIFSIVVFVICLFFMRDLSPKVRDQIMASERDRALVQARAQGITEAELEAGIKNPWRQILKGDLLGSAFGISLFLLFYFIAASFFTIYYVVTFYHPNGLPFTTVDANSLNEWFWGADIVALIIVGWASDKLRVRKPFMLAGALLTIPLVLIFASFATKPQTSFTTLALLGVLMAFTISIAYAPWMAGYTESVEARNPALVATGLALWGWILRICVSISFIFFPMVVSTAGPIVNNNAVATDPIPQCYLAPKLGPLPAVPGPTVPAGQNARIFQALHPDSVKFAEEHATLLKLVASHYRIVAAANVAAPTGAAITAIEGALGSANVSKLLALKADFNTLVVPYSCQLNYLSANQAALLEGSNALAKSPKQWQTWFYIDAAGMVLFIPFIFLTRGRWSPKKAKEDFDAREAAVSKELEQLTGSKS